MPNAKRILACIALPIQVALAQPAQDAVGPAARYTQAATILERFIRHEMADKALPALSIALVAGDSVVWARGFGIASPRDSTPATARTLYRVGSVSTLFTDLGVMPWMPSGRT